MAVGVSNFPASLDTAVELIQPANNAITELDGSLTNSATTIVVNSTASFSAAGMIAIGDELVTYTGKTSTSFTGCTRGYDGTTALSHTSGTSVEDVIARAHHNVLSTAILSTQTKLGSGSSTPVVNTVLRGTGTGSSAYGQVVNADISPTAGIAYAKLALTGSIVNADVATGAAIDYSKLATLTADRLLVSSAVGAVSASTLTWNATDSAIGGLKAIDFTSVTTTAAPLRLQWNTDLATAQIGLTSTVTLPIGQTEVVHVKRSTNNGLAKGKVVYVVGSDGANKTVAYAQANSATTTKTTLGIIAETVNGGAKAFCVTKGLCLGITTTGLTEGAPVYLSSSSAGDLVLSVPTPPNHRVRIGYCIKEHATQGVIYVDVQTGYDVAELCDVSATVPIAAGSTLIRNATTGVWTAATLTAGSGVTITNGDGAITISSSGVAGGTTGDYQVNSSGAFAAGILSQSSGRLTSTSTAASSGVVPYLRIIAPADTGLTASTEAPGIVFGGDASGSTVTRTRAAGTVTTQREYIFTAPTYAAASATTITTAATLAVTGAPIAGSNVTLTESFAALFRTDTTAQVASIALQNANSSGWNGISFRNNAGSQRALIAYTPTANESLRLYYGGSFYVGDPTAYALMVDGSYNVAIGTTTEASARCIIAADSSKGASTSANSLRVYHGTNSSVNAFQIQTHPWVSNSDVRYGFFLSSAESRSRITDSHGGQQDRGTITETVTLSTAGATTDTTIQIPANSLVLGVTVRVTTTVAGVDSTSLQIGDATTANRFGSIAVLTAGATGVGLNHLQGGVSSDATGPIFTSATAIRLTLSGGADNTPSAGAVRVTIHYIALTAPTS